MLHKKIALQAEGSLPDASLTLYLWDHSEEIPIERRPLILILPQFFGIDGVLYSAPIADFMAAVLAFFLTFRQLNKLGK